MKRISIAIALLISSADALKMFSHNNIHSNLISNNQNQHKSSNYRLEAWNEISKNVNVAELLQSEENALNEQVAGQNLHVKEIESNDKQSVEKNSVADILASNSGVKSQREITELIQQGVMDPTAGDIPNNQEQHDVIANILSSPADNATQEKLVKKVTDDHKAHGVTKAPVVPIPNVNVSDVESKPDPSSIDADSETLDAPDTSIPVADIGPNSLAQSMLKEVNQQQSLSENSQFIAMKQQHSQQIVGKVSNMNKEMDEFSHTLDMKHYDNAMVLQKELKKDGLRNHEKLMSVTTKELFKQGFKAFPQIAQNEYVQDQLGYLEAAEDNLNGNLINVRLVQALVDRGQEVATNLSKTYGEQWSNPLKD